jgi:hypothetical protein
MGRVLWEMNRAELEELNGLADEMKVANDKKQSIRNALDKLSKLDKDHYSAAERTAVTAELRAAGLHDLANKIDAALTATTDKAVIPDKIKNAREIMDRELETLGDFSQEKQFELQQANTLFNQLQTALSQMEKTNSDTGNNIIKNV